MTTREAMLVHHECEYAVVDVSDNTTTVFTGPCIVYGVYVTTVLSAHVLPVYDGSVNVFSLPASAAAGTSVLLPGLRFDTSLIVDPNDAATGGVTVAYRKVNPA